ncbi:PH domain-containing protein [Enterococcus sp. LJL98]
MNVLLIALLIFTYGIQIFTLSLAARPHQQVILENTLPKESLGHPFVRALCKKYRHTLFLLGAFFSLSSTSLLFTSYDSIQLTIFWLLLFSSLGAMYLCKIFYIHRMKELVTNEHWQLEIEPKRIDTKLVLEKNQKMVASYWLYLAFLPTFPLAWYTFKVTDLQTSILLFLCHTGFFLMMLYMYHYVGRIPAKSLTNHPQTNKQLNDLTKHHWSFLLVLTNWWMLPLLFLPIFMMEAAGIFAIVLTTLFIASLLGFVFFIIGYLYLLRKKQDTLLMQQSEYRYNGEDAYWRYGVYINPDDPKLFVPDRIGMNLGINLGRRSGQVIMGVVTLLLIVTIFFTLIPSYLYDFTKNPLQLSIHEQAIQLSAPLAKRQTIPLEDIKAIQLVDRLPTPLIKTFGTATDNYAIGRFSSNQHTLYLYVDYHSKPILWIQTADADYYYTNKIEAKTIELYQKLK